MDRGGGAERGGVASQRGESTVQNPARAARLVQAEMLFRGKKYDYTINPQTLHLFPDITLDLPHSVSLMLGESSERQAPSQLGLTRNLKREWGYTHSVCQYKLIGDSTSHKQQQEQLAV